MYDAIVIGGGITGLAVSFRLKEMGFDFRILEPNLFGGLVKTSRTNGFLLEHGPNVLLEKEELTTLLRELGLEADIVRPYYEPYRQYVWYNGNVQSLPKSPGTFFKTPLLTFYDKLAVPFRILLPGLCRPNKDDESVYEFFSRILGDRGVRAIIEPALSGIYGGDLFKLSARSIFGELWHHLKNGKSVLSFFRNRKRKRMFVLRKGMGSLVEAILNRLEIENNSSGEGVNSLSYERTEKRFKVVTQKGEILYGKSVYVSTSGTVTAKYVEEFLPQLSMRLKTVRFAPIVVLHFGSTEQVSLPERAFGVLFPRDSKSKILGVMFNSNLFPHMAPKDRQLFTVCFGGVGGEEVIEKTDEELFEVGREELMTKLGLKGLISLGIERWRDAIPQYEVGHFEIIKEQQLAEKNYPGLFFVGADTGGVGVPDRVRIAFEAVNRATLFEKGALKERKPKDGQQKNGEEKHAMFRM